MRQRKPLGRRGKTRPELRRFLIYCEDECAGKQYFKGLRAELRSRPVQVCIGPRHGEPVTLVKDAIAHRDRAPQSPQDRCTAYDEVWCVMDVEAPRPHPGIGEALELARNEGVSVALTNPCFELWILLHFSDITAYRTSKEAQRLLEAHDECRYSTVRKHLRYEPLASRYADARERARRLRERAGSADPLRENPWVNVDDLVDVLKGCG